MRHSAIVFALLLVGLVWQPARGEDVTFDLNFNALNGSIGNVQGVDEVQIRGGGIFGAIDAVNDGVFGPGDTFHSFNLFTATRFTDVLSNDVTPVAYGTRAGATHELTFSMVLQGVNTSPNMYEVTSLDLIFYADVGGGTGGFTPSRFSNLSSFTDGTVVETGSLYVDTTSGGTYLGPSGPLGTLGLTAVLTDQLAGTDFQLDSETGDSLISLAPTVLGSITAAQLVAPFGGAPRGRLTSGTFGVTDGYDAIFAGLSGTQNADGTIGALSLDGVPFDYAFATSFDGSFIKAVVPEPVTAANLCALACCGVPLVVRRRRRSS